MVDLIGPVVPILYVMSVIRIAASVSGEVRERAPPAKTTPMLGWKPVVPVLGWIMTAARDVLDGSLSRIRTAPS